MNEQAFQRQLDKVRMKILMIEPLLGAVSSRLRWEIKDGSEVAATDGATVFIFPRTFEFDLPQQLFVLAHELLHVLHLHHIRKPKETKGSEFHALAWNLACDVKINRELRGSNSCRAGRIQPVEEGVFSLQELGVPDDVADASTEEEIYRMLISNLPDTEPQREQMQAMLGETGEDVQDAPGGGEGEDGDGEGENTDGKVAGNGEQDAPKPITMDDVRQIVAQVSLTTRGFDLSGACGGKLVADLLQPKMSWRQALMDYLQNRSHGDEPTWRRRNRRHVDTILPGREEDIMPVTVVALDVSGSCHSAAGEFLSELRGLVEQVAFERLVLLIHDSKVLEVHDSEQYDDPLTMVEHVKETGLPSGGGTDYDDVLAKFWEHDAEVLIWLTDMCANRVDRSAPDDVLFVVKSHQRVEDIEEERDYIFRRPVGMVIKMED